MQPSITTSIDNQPLLSTDAAAKLLGVSPGTLVVWRSTGRYPLPFVKVGRRVMYRLEDIHAFIQSRTMLHTEKSLHEAGNGHGES
jgi:excisionase family DNA binding protein